MASESETARTTTQRGQGAGPRRVAWLALALGLVTACRSVPHPPKPDPYDAGPTPDAAVTASLAGRYAATASRQGTERCRCAIDVPYCRYQVDADWDANGLACLQDAAALDVTGFEAMVACLEVAVSTLESCQAPLACQDTAGRADCVSSWRTAGSACFDLAAPAVVAAVLTCTPLTLDAGP